MDIQFVDLNSPLRIYYKARNLTSGQDVVFNVWTESGVPIVLNASADGEIGTRGVYYLDITTPNANVYILVKASLASGVDVATSVYAVGTPSRKAFYVDPRYATSRTISYQVFDINATREVEDQNLTEVAGGFYYADVSGIDSQEDLFFKVGQFVTQFDLRQLVIISGGVIAAGGASIFITFTEQTTNGVVVNGEAEVELFGTSGGVLVDGIAEVYTEISIGGGVILSGSIGTGISSEITGGAEVGGTASVLFSYNITPENGVVINGTAGMAIGGGVSGGAEINGTANVVVVYNITVTNGAVGGGSAISGTSGEVGGGVIADGTSAANAIYHIITTGGSVVNGAATPGISSEVSGGASADGTSAFYVMFVVASENGATLNGSGIIAIGGEVGGGVFVDGAAIHTSIYDNQTTGGASVNGSAIIGISSGLSGGAEVDGTAIYGLTTFEIAENGAIASGIAEETFFGITPISGGSQVGGVAEVVAIYNIFAIGGGLVYGDFTGKITEELTSGGATVSGKASIGIQPTIAGAGVKLGGEATVTDDFWNYLRDRYYLYDIGDIVYLRYPSKDYLPSYYEQHTVEGIRIFGDHNLYDIGIGILVDEGLLISDLNKEQMQSAEANYTIGYSGQQINRLEGLPRLADPTGGEISESETISPAEGDYRFAEIAKNRLARTSPLPNPTGGEISVSASEEACCRLPRSVVNKLNRLLNTSVLPDPVGGTVQISSMEVNTNVITSGIRNKLNRLRGATALPAPTGGVMLFSETDGESGVEVSSIQRKIDQLQDVAMIPGPTGAYIIVSMDTESGDEVLNEIKDSAARKLKKLIGV